MAGNREYKSDVFSMLMQDKRRALELYNAINNAINFGFKKSNLKIIALGGLDEIGKNITVFEYENEIILNRDKEYEYIERCEDGLIAQIDSDSDNCEIIPYEHINLDYVPFIGINYKRPKLELIQNKIFKIDLNLSLPKKELIDYVSKIIDEYEKDSNASIMSPLELIGFDRSRGNRVDKNKINKGLIAKKFFVYDYVSIRLEQIEDSNQDYIIEYEENKKIIENNPYINR